MAEKYYLHRISHEGNVSYALIKQEYYYITLGWSMFADSGILDAARVPGYPDFDKITQEYGQNRNRSRWSMWYFAQMDKGDYVVVPLCGGEFSVFEVEDIAKPISDLESVVTSFRGAWDDHEIVWNNHRLFDKNDNRIIDLGFFIKVKPVVENVPRRFVTGKFISRMKIRTTCADITDIRNHVDLGIKAGIERKPITLYEDVIDPLVERMRTSIDDILDPDKFEYLVKWYLEKCGASSAWIPPKNESGKRDGADADIIAEFENLKYIVYVQAKHHKGETSDWAVYQVDSYKNQKSEGEADYTYATWVVSSADNFSPKATEQARSSGVRLIDGNEFARMLIDIGLLDLNDAFESFMV